MQALRGNPIEGLSTGDPLPLSELRFQVGLCRSGTTMFQKAASHVEGAVTSKCGIRYGLKLGNGPDYSIYDTTQPVGSRWLVHKENLGGSSLAQCTVPVFRGPEDIRRSRPVFLIREPVQTYNSWKRQGWGQILSYWDMPHDEDTLDKVTNWPTAFTGEETLGNVSGQIADDFRRNVATGVHDTLLKGEQRVRHVINDLVISDADVSNVRRIGEMIFAKWQAVSSRLLKP